MKGNYHNISAIETHLDSVIRKHISKNCYATTLPSTLSDNVKSYVVIDCATAIKDFNAYSSGIVNIYLYAQPTGKGAKNVAELSKLEKAFNDVLNGDLFDDEHYTVERETVYSNTDYDSTYKMHFIIKAIYLKVLPDVPKKPQAPTSYDLWLMAYDADKKVPVIKLVDDITGLGIADSKKLTESAPCMIIGDISYETAQEYADQFAEVNAETKILPHGQTP